MGKKRISTLGSEAEEQEKTKKAIKLEQKKLREGKAVSKDAKKIQGQDDNQVVVETGIKPRTDSDISPDRPPQNSISETSPKPSAVKRVRTRSEAYKLAKKKINSDRTYPVSEALELLKQVSLTKFDPTIELHIVLKSGSFNQNIELPFSTGKTKRIAVADDTTITKIESGKIDFDVLFASPGQMAKLVKFAKVLGPRGLMPNPKNGTVVADPEAAAKKMSGTVSVTLKTEKSAPVIHTSVGKLSQKQSELIKNIETVIAALPAGNFKKIVVKSTMSPAIKITLT